MTAVLQVVHTLADVALAQLFANKTGHHDLNPLLPGDGVLGSLEGLGVIVVDSVEGRRDLGLVALEELGLGGRHCEYLSGAAYMIGIRGVVGLRVDTEPQLTTGSRFESFDVATPQLPQFGRRLSHASILRPKQYVLWKWLVSTSPLR